jgi:hypothetical protein
MVFPIQTSKDSWLTMFMPIGNVVQIVYGSGHASKPMFNRE